MQAIVRAELAKTRPVKKGQIKQMKSLIHSCIRVLIQIKQKKLSINKIEKLIKQDKKNNSNQKLYIT